ncbi:LptF/LptG family permease [Parasegetibacter sp. MAH-26]|uniref:LptF/LptG family permease n=2 Tax=Pinibacter aurantiacus TaxID=2851599 RepID=A0A9E2W265_9BACT|nr:LptF/LptG family permease [Pinibacter aurantiacus]
MKILDWYILKNFLVTFVFTIMTITTIAVVIDVSEKTDDFVRSGLSFGGIVTKYYFGFVPFIVSMIFPLIVFIAIIFFTSKMAARTETVAILASGIPYNRMLRPYFMGGILLAVVLWLLMAFVIPRAQEIRSNFQTTYIDRNSGYVPGGTNNSSDFYFRADSNTFVGLRYYDTARKAANSFFLEKIRNNTVYYNLRGDNIHWDTATKKWSADRVQERTIDGLHEKLTTHQTMTLNLNVLPKDLRKDEYLKDKLTTPELRAFIRAEQQRGGEGLNNYIVELNRRNATPVAILILTVIGVSVAARKTRGGSGLNLAIGIVMAASFVVMDKFSTVFSTKGNLHPMLAAWLPNIIYSFAAFWLYKRAPK